MFVYRMINIGALRCLVNPGASSSVMTGLVPAITVGHAASRGCRHKAGHDVGM
jgi:hypothetical protein